MADMARNRETGSYHYAIEIAFDDQLAVVEWKCLGCEAHMIAAAADGLKKYIRAPYFRLKAGYRHDVNCDEEGLYAEEGQRSLRKIGIPERLILQGIGERAPLNGPEELGEPRHERHVGHPEAEGLLGYRVGSLYPVVQYYRQPNADLGRQIRLLDWPVAPYRFTFRRLSGRVSAVELHAHRVFSSGIFFRDVSFQENMIVVPLLAFWGEERYTLEVDLGNFTARQAQTVENTFRAFQNTQKELFISGSEQSVVVYFMGERDNAESTRFKLIDPRLCCFRIETL